MTDWREGLTEQEVAVIETQAGGMAAAGYPYRPEALANIVRNAKFDQMVKQDQHQQARYNRQGHPALRKGGRR
ncbi:hypothetical protein [Deinococcus sp. QL22]|uniref:hypothetical protein n=1 Tax=Deinococcus sp. QL22 TaxID=2939437 RepID=UPI00201789B1|nr:hypothetical protein [Deinococcus sp. QL22]UQN10394.1 hypothetical protein M1R55_30030 [Deinococcus sp. QL22]UQN10528.1 hypothetical protein M1R55_29355 [Deinococcus sp. QL22]